MRENHRPDPGRAGIVMVAIALLFGGVSCDPRLAGDYEEEDSADFRRSGRVTYPFVRTISNKKQVRLEGTVLGKKGQTIMFQRAADGKEFEIPLSTLSADDVFVLASLPDGGHTSRTSQPDSAARDTSSDEERRRFSFEKRPWRTYAEALAAAEKSGLPVLVVATGISKGVSGDSYNSTSASFQRAVLNDRGFKSFVGEHTEFVYFDLNNHLGIEDRPNVDVSINYSTAVTTILFSPAGKQMYSWTGYDKKGPTPYINRIKNVLGISTSF